MKVVLDTNVLVSGLLNPDGNPGRVLDLLLAGEITLLVDDRILAEYRAVLARPRFGFDVGDIVDVISQIEAESEEPDLSRTLICPLVRGCQRLVDIKEKMVTK